MKWNEDDIEYIIEHLNVPDSVWDEEFIQWLEKSDNQRLFETILHQREAFLRHEDYGHINPETEYQRFVKQIMPTKQIRIWKWTAGAASIAILFIVLFWISSEKNNEVPVSKMDNLYKGRKTAELVLANGQRIKLEHQLIELQEENGIKIINDSSCQLSYQPMTTLQPSKREENKLVYNTLHIPAGADYVVCLSDGTKVRLNCESEFRFPLTFSKQERKVYLDGEAFFEVTKAEEWPFIVVTDKMDVRVTGTRFNVCAYQKDQVVSATLVDGSVKIRTSRNTPQEISLIPSQQFNLNKNTGQTEVKKVDVNLYTGWTEGMFVFRNQRLEEVMNTLARWYSIEVFYKEPAVKDLRLSANLGRYEHIDTLLRVIKAMDKIDMERKDNIVIISQK
ncbi:MAG: FecR domain-containing protein [Odoribacter sp.]